jgi:hypothetical protein
MKQTIDTSYFLRHRDFSQSRTLRDNLPEVVSAIPHSDIPA